MVFHFPYFPVFVDSAISCCRLYECLWPMVHRHGSSQRKCKVCTKLVDADAIGYTWNLVLLILIAISMSC